jgi:hypothetical protein
MTPMLQALMRHAMLPRGKERMQYRGALGGPPAFSPVPHAFEVSQLFELARRAVDGLRDRKLADAATAHLPFDDVWMEFAIDGSEFGHPKDTRHGIFLRRAKGPFPIAEVMGWVYSPGQEVLSDLTRRFLLPLQGAPYVGEAMTSEHLGSIGEHEQTLASLVYALLAMINSPRALARREHAPHKGLDRDLRRTGQPGLRPWTEILLELPGGRRIERDDAAPPADGRGSAKAEHWVRMHPRFKLGRLEWVTAHKRGDPTLGTVQATYRVRPQPGQQPSDET